jgi:hypothetical protein
VEDIISDHKREYTYIDEEVLLNLSRRIDDQCSLGAIDDMKTTWVKIGRDNVSAWLGT